MRQSDEMDFDRIRNFTPAQRQANFAAFKGGLAEKVRNSDSEPRWHPIDDPMSPDQVAELPAARENDTRTPLVWVKFTHPRTKTATTAKGYFDHDGCRWVVRSAWEEDDWKYGQVAPTAWAAIKAR